MIHRYLKITSIVIILTYHLKKNYNKKITKERRKKSELIHHPLKEKRKFTFRDNSIINQQISQSVFRTMRIITRTKFSLLSFPLTLPSAALVHAGRESLVPGGLPPFHTVNLGIPRRLFSFVGHIAARLRILKRIRSFLTAFKSFTDRTLRADIILQRLADLPSTPLEAEKFVYKLWDVGFTSQLWNVNS